MGLGDYYRMLKIWLRLQPYINKIKEIAKMKISVNSILQILMLAGQGANAVADVLPEGGKLWVAVALSIIQGVVGVLAHFHNPDGTTAKVAYIKE